MKLIELIYRRETRVPVLALTLATAIGVALVLTRVVFTHNLKYGLLVGNLVLAWIPLVLALLALFSVTILIIALTWETAARNWVIAGVALLYAAGAVWSCRRLKQVVAQSPPPFAATLEEFKKDREWFRKEN